LDTRLVVGLGNPGTPYTETRHNIGFMIVEHLAEELGTQVSKKGFSSLWSKVSLKGRDVLLQEPQTFMNLSGQAVREMKDYYRVEDQRLIVIHDDLDLPLGRIKPDYQAGAGGHRGVNSIIESLGVKSFHRLRVGIGRPEKKEEVEGYVLSLFSKSEKESVKNIIKEACELLKQWVLSP